MSFNTAIGIDLGTTFSAFAIIDEYGKPIILENLEDSKLTPSVIFFENDGTIIVGDEAKQMQATGENNVASFFKRSMGNSDFAFFHGDNEYSAIDLSAILLGYIKKSAEAVLGRSIDKAVITVPAYFDNLQREATIVAAEQAGLKVLRIINEPTAAAIAFGLNKQEDAKQRLMVYDLGGGTFDVTIIEIDKGSVLVKATGGEHELGGKDWDDRILEFLAVKFEQEFDEDPLEDLESFNDLMVKAEEAKRSLSSRQKTKVSIIHEGNKGSYTITREEFEDLTKDLLQRTQMMCELILEEAGMTWADLDGVLPIGGSTKMPMVSSWIEKISGKPGIKGINVDEAVCLGAAITAAIALKDEPGSILQLPSAPKGMHTIAGISIQDVMSHSLGLIAENGDRSAYVNTIIITKNKKIPSVEVRPYKLKTRRTGATELEVYMTQGESKVPLHNKFLGKYVFTGIESEASGVAVIDISYAYDENGVIQITAIQRSNKKELTLTVEPIPADMSWLDLPPIQHQSASMPHVSVMLAIDLSGSMHGNPLAKAQQAAYSFIDKLDLTNTSIGLLCFADKSFVNLNLTSDTKKLKKGILSWKKIMDSNKVGYGNLDDPFSSALTVLKKRENPRFIIVLTDGVWYRQKKAIKRAQLCAEQGIEIIAIGFGSADEKFLRKIATSDSNALFTNLGNLVESFSKIAQVLTEDVGGDTRGLNVMNDDDDAGEGKKNNWLNFFGN